MLAKPDDAGIVVATLKPGEFLEVIGISGDWFNIIYAGVTCWLKRQAGDIALALPQVPKLYSKHHTLPFGSGLRIRAKPSDSAPIVGMFTDQFVLGLEIRGTWVRILRDFSATSEWIQTITAEDIQLLQACTVHDNLMSLMCISDSLPENASVRIRQAPSTSAEVIHVVAFNDCIAVSEVVEGWAHVVAEGVHGWILTVSDGKNLLQKFSAKVPGVLLSAKKARPSFGGSGSPNRKKDVSLNRILYLCILFSLLS